MQRFCHRDPLEKVTHGDDNRPTARLPNSIDYTIVGVESCAACDIGLLLASQEEEVEHI